MNCMRIGQPFFYLMQIQKVTRAASSRTLRKHVDYDVQNPFENLWITS